MKPRRLDAQPDLFATGATGLPVPTLAMEPPPPDFVERIREELMAVLALVTGAVEIPWADPTKALLTQMRFRSIANWLPPEEAAGLRAAFEVELLRLYGPEPVE